MSYLAELRAALIVPDKALFAEFSTRATEHHADLAITASIAFYLSNNAPMAFVEAPLAGYWG